eukprot:snap_masked-scaffold_7-processed-gene-19.67-mRNA-1 protein AED:1.00 eAED:1.00 QI:0/0/0/0/1/1/2/0/344
MIAENFSPFKLFSKPKGNISHKKEAHGTNSKVTEVIETAVDVVFKLTAVGLIVYSLFSLFSIIAWVSHLGARVPFLQNFLIGGGLAKNKPVSTIPALFIENAPPTLQKLVGFRFARLLYCGISGFTLHLFLLYFRPLNMNEVFSECLDSGNETCFSDYKYSEDDNIPLFTLPYPKIVQDTLSIVMLIFAYYAMLSDKRTYIVLGFNRAFFGPNHPVYTDKFPRDLTPRMDIITWIGYTTFLKAGSVGFILFSGVSILPHKVYLWDILVRVVAAAYLRHRSKGFNIFVGKIESTHHFIWAFRAGLVALALYTQSHLIQFSAQAVGLMIVLGCLAGLGLHLLEKQK